MELTRGERLQIMLTEEELKALDDWRFTRRMPSRAAAIRELLKRGLAAEGVVMMDGKSKSEDFGVTDGEPRAIEWRWRRKIHAQTGLARLPPALSSVA